MHSYEHEWFSPLSCLAACAPHYPDTALLYSGTKTSYSGDISWLAIESAETIAENDLTSLHALSAHQPTHFLPNGTPVPVWLGHIAYELGYDCVGLPRPQHPTTDALAHVPLLCFTRYKRVFAFLHSEQKLIEFTSYSSPFDWHAILPSPQTLDTPTLHAQHLSSNMSKDMYIQAVLATKSAIEAGEFYQANITRKFFAQLDEIPSAAVMSQLFTALCAASPAPYSAYIQSSAHAARILSSSPELFISHTPHKNNFLQSRPIKGTMPKESTPASLAKSAKNQAENLMIVDLMRNDFSRICEQGSVHVPVLFDVDSFSTLHHLSSTVAATTRCDVKLRDIITACFPAGSMTGAPKHRVMQWCNLVEQSPRGIYSGALGWIAGDACEFSVVIRTLIQQQQHLEFQVGGGIVYDSDAHDEWQETLTKARALCTVLQIHPDDIAAL